MSKLQDPRAWSEADRLALARFARDPVIRAGAKYASATPRYSGPTDDFFSRLEGLLDAETHGALAVDLALVRTMYAGIMAGVKRAAPTEAPARVTRQRRSDTKCFKSAARGLAKAVRELEGLSQEFAQAMLEVASADWLDKLRRWRDLLTALSQWEKGFAVRGRPPMLARRVADDVARVLAAHGIRPTVTENGKFERILRIMIDDLRLDAADDLRDLVRDAVEATRAGRKRGSGTIPLVSD